MLTRPSEAICSRYTRSLLRNKPGRRGIATQTSPSPPPASGAARLTNRRLISLHGPEAPKFLQGIITNNVHTDSASSSGFFAAFLTAQGKVLNDVFIYPTAQSRWQAEQYQDSDQGYLVEVDSEQAELLFKHLKRHKLRTKLKLRLLEPGELDVWSVWKEDERWTQHTKARSHGDVIRAQDGRAPGMGQRMLLPSTTSTSSVSELDGVKEASLDTYTVRRYLKGIAEGQHEIPREESLPMNYNFDLMGGIDFKKGCYIGQELTIRTHHTGVVRRRVLPVSLYDAASEAPADLLYDPASEMQLGGNHDIKKNGFRKRATGKLIANIGNVGLAMCRLEQMSDLTISAESGSFDPADRFVIERDGTTDLGVKAFVPDWVRSQIRAPRVQRRVE